MSADLIPNKRAQHGGGLVVPFGCWDVARACLAVPGAVGVPRQAALGAGLAVEVTPAGRHLGDALVGDHEELLLWEGGGGVGGGTHTGYIQLLAGRGG